MRRSRNVSLRRQGGWSWLDYGKLALDAYQTYSATSAGSKAKKSGAKADAAQQALLAAQTNLGYANEARSEESYDNYMSTALPANERALSLAMKPIDPNTEAAQAGADYALADKTRSDTLHRNLQRNGVDPSSGAAVESERLGLLDSVAGKAAAMTTSRRGATDRQIARIGNTSGLFNPLIGAASGFSASAGANMASAAAAQGKRADAATSAAGDAGLAAGQSLSDLAGDFATWWGSRKKTPTTNPVDGP